MNFEFGDGDWWDEWECELHGQICGTGGTGGTGGTSGSGEVRATSGSGERE